MPIPQHDPILNVLPPYLDDPREIAGISPYRCTVLELVERYRTSTVREKLLRGLLELRERLRERDVDGFQWIGGSFVEDIEAQENRPPNDIDVVTFVALPRTVAEFDIVRKQDAVLFDNLKLKNLLGVEHFYVLFGSRGELIVELTNYYTQLFGHRRDDVRKGLVRLELIDSTDAAARELLEQRS
jgi:hypothetical protein